MRRLDPMRVDLAGTTLVEASAGTGKTYTITTLLLRLIVELELDVDQILVVTFTRAATAELRERIRARLRAAVDAFEAGGGTGDEVLDALVSASADRERDRRHLLQALGDFDEASISTIHGFCQRMLHENAFESGVLFDTELVEDEAALVVDVVRDFWTREMHDAPAVLVRFLGSGTLRDLERLASQVAGRPDVPVLAGERDVDLGAAWAAFERARGSAAAIWRERRGEITDLILSALDDRSLSGNKYRRASLPGWFGQMDGVLDPDAPGTHELFERFEKFTTPVLARSANKGRTPPSHPFFEACDDLESAREHLVSALEGRLVRLKADLVAFVRSELPRRKARANVQSFDDLLMRLDSALDGPNSAALARLIRSRYRAVLIDEFQDTDPVQYRIFRKVYHDTGEPLFLIGDPKQSIYAFRGADIYAYLGAVTDAGDRSYTLETNWRSDPMLIEAVNHLFEPARMRAPFVFEEIGYVRVEPSRDTDRLFGEKVEGALEVLVVPRDGENTTADGVIRKSWAWRNLPGMCASEIAHLLASDAHIVEDDDERPVSPGDVAVLVRMNRQARDMQAALRALSIPSVLRSPASVFETVEADEVEKVVRAMGAPQGAGTVRVALSTSLFGLSASDLASLGQDEEAWESWMESFRSWNETWARRGFVRAFRTMLDESEVRSRLLGLVDGERRLTNVLHLGELLHVASSRSGLGPGALAGWLARMRAAPSGEVAGDEAQIRLESDERAVQLVTIYKSKGLEYPLVYLPDLWDGRLLRGGSETGPVLFHDPVLRLDIGSPSIEDHRTRAAHEARAENLRLLYVALTRARHRTTVFWGGFNESDTSPLGYLLHHRPGDGTSATARTEAHVGSLDDARMLEELEELERSSSGSIFVRPVTAEPGPAYTPPTADHRELACRTPSRTPGTLWGLTSFSRLASARRPLSLPAEQGRDHDEMAEEIPGAPAPSPEPVVLDAFPRGAGPGTFLHEVLEELDFPAADDDAIHDLVGRKLAAHGMDPDAWTGPVSRSISDVIRTRLPGASGLSLERIPASRRIAEMEFLFPVALAREAVGSTMIAAALSRHAREPVPGTYPDAVAALDFVPARGFLRGFVDLVFEHEGRWYVVDYKSNHLGSTHEDYGPGPLARAMAHGHYFLQYHLYALALHRHLALRLPGYDHETHMGGVYYLFLRGMSPGRSTGIFHDRPPLALIDELSDLVGEVEP
jgi:exodeoxyribonuclease V beta subunit